MRVLVTRPQRQATAWVDSLREHGIDAAALPLIGIAGAPEPAAVVQAWATLHERRLVVFVSPNAVQSFFDLMPPGTGWAAGVLAASPGPGTTRILARLGVPQALIVEPAADAAQFDSESLWASLAVRDWHGASVLVVRGVGGRDWLVDRLTGAGASVDDVAAYARAAPAFGPAEQRLFDTALDAPRRHVWLFSSSEAIDRLQALADAERWAAATAIATHPRIAARAQQLGFARVIACRPTLDAVVACIQSIRP